MEKGSHVISRSPTASKTHSIFTGITKGSHKKQLANTYIHYLLSKSLSKISTVEAQMVDTYRDQK